MRIPFIIAAGLLLVAGAYLPTWADGPDVKKQAELKWAKGVAIDFLQASVRENSSDQAKLLVTAELKKETESDRHWFLRVRNAQLGLPIEYSISEEAIAPDQDETSFKGVFKGTSAKANFALRVVKEKESGKWRVSYFSFTVQDKK